MAFFDFFKRKRKPSGEQEQATRKQPKQGFYRERVNIPSRIGGLPPEFVTMEGNYENDKREGHWIIKDENGREGFVNYASGKEHGLGKSLEGGYSLYYYGRVIKTPLEFRQEWERELKSYRAMIKAGKDKEGNYSSKLEKLLAEGEEKWIEASVNASRNTEKAKK